MIFIINATDYTPNGSEKEWASLILGGHSETVWECLDIGTKEAAFIRENSREFGQRMHTAALRVIADMHEKKEEGDGQSVVCRNCRHWRHIRDESLGEWPGPHGECHRIDMDSQAVGAWTYDDLGDEPSLITMPQFGCNQFEKRCGPDKGE